MSCGYFYGQTVVLLAYTTSYKSFVQAYNLTGGLIYNFEDIVEGAEN